MPRVADGQGVGKRLERTRARVPGAHDGPGRSSGALRPERSRVHVEQRGLAVGNRRSHGRVELGPVVGAVARVGGMEVARQGVGSDRPPERVDSDPGRAQPACTGQPNVLLVRRGGDEQRVISQAEAERSTPRRRDGQWIDRRRAVADDTTRQAQTTSPTKARRALERAKHCRGSVQTGQDGQSYAHALENRQGQSALPPHPRRRRPRGRRRRGPGDGAGGAPVLNPPPPPGGRAHRGTPPRAPDVRPPVAARASRRPRARGHARRPVRPGQATRTGDRRVRLRGWVGRS